MFLLIIILILIIAATLGYYAGKYFPPVIRILPPVLFFFWDPVLHGLSHHVTSVFMVPVGIYLIAAYIGTAKKNGKSRAIYNLDWYILIAAVFVVWILASFSPPHSASKEAICQYNLEMIAMAAISYEQDNDKWPETFSDIAMYIQSPKRMTCPSDVNKPGDLTDVDDWSDYVLIPRDMNLPASKTVIVYCPHVHNHEDVRNVAFADGRVDRCPLDQIIGETNSNNQSKP